MSAKRITWLLLAALCGCTTVRIEQIDESRSTDETRTIRTEVKGTAWLSGAQTLSRLKTTQTDKTQGIGVDGLWQTGPTNDLDRLLLILQLLRR